MTTKTKQRDQISTDEAITAYVEAIQRHQEAEHLVNRAILATEAPGPSDEQRRAEAKRTTAREGMIEARAALEAATGATAVQLAEARVVQEAIAREVEETRFSRRSPTYAANLATRERMAGLEVERLTGQVDEERARVEAYERLEADNGPLLDELTAGLTAARAQLAGAVQAAQEALAAVHVAAGEYGAVAADAGRRLAAVGFRGDHRPDGEPFATTPCAELRVQGNLWPVPHPQRTLAWTVRQSVLALNGVGSPIEYALRRYINIDQRILDMLLGAPVDGRPKR